jgi:hypothetical protein
VPKRTFRDLEKLHGVTRDQLNAAKSKGVNIWDDAECARYLGTRRHKIKPDAKIPPKDPAVTAATIEEMRNALAVAIDYETVKILTEKIKGLQNAAKLQRELRDLIPIAEVEERDIRIGAVVKAGMLKLCNDSAPMAEGLGAAAIHKILMDQGHQVLAMMSDEQSDFWKQFA